MKNSPNHNHRLLSLIIGMALILGPMHWAMAGEISSELKAVMSKSAAGKKIPEINQLKNDVNTRQFKKLKKKLRRKKLIQALKQQAAEDKAGLDSVLAGKPGLKFRQLWLINGLAVEVNKNTIRQFAKLKAVETIRLDGVIVLADAGPSGSGTAAWNLSMIQADTMWNQGYEGQGVVIAAMDTGVDGNHNALAASYRGGANSWYDPNGEHADPFDADGHGTQTMGVLVGDNGMGVAPMAQWMAVKIFDDSGLASYSAIHAGFQWLLDPDNDPTTDDAPDVVNNSWGFNASINECFTEFEDDIAAFRAVDIPVVFSGGNSGSAAYTSLSPANNAGSLAVGALDSNGQVISSSSTGPSACGGGLYPQLTAPGLSIYTANLTYNGIFPDMTTHASGTSLSAPHISGAIALLISALPDAALDDMEQALWSCALDLGHSGPDDSYGYGLVQTADALSALGGGTEPPVDPLGPICTDVDEDGFFDSNSDPACGGPADCIDSDPTVYPGATEVHGDHIDQDCNGYDLTINIKKAIYRSSKDKVIIFATSDLGAAAALKMDIAGVGTKNMTWKSTKNRWQKTIAKASSKGFDRSNPGNVLVSGVEGEISVPIRIK